jgi:hypothetical protein
MHRCPALLLAGEVLATILTVFGPMALALSDIVRPI